MRYSLRHTTCSLAVAAAFAAITPLQASAALPAPTTGPLEVWFRQPANWSNVAGTVQSDGCYVEGRGAVRVDFFLDSTLLNSDTNVADGMTCALDTTKFANGSHQ